MKHLLICVSALVFAVTGETVPKCDTESCIQNYGNLKEILGKVQYLVSTNLKSNNMITEELQQVKDELKAYKEENKNLTDTVNSQKAQLEAQATQLTQLSKQQNDVKEEVTGLSEQVTCQLGLLGSLNADIAQCQDGNSNPNPTISTNTGNQARSDPVAFMVYRKDALAITGDDRWRVLAFPIVSMNLDGGNTGGWIPGSNYFHAPVKGLYVFSSRVTSYGAYGVLVTLVINSNQVSKSAAYVAGSVTASQTDVVELKKSDKVWVEVYPGSNNPSHTMMLNATTYYHAFSGYLWHQLD